MSKEVDVSVIIPTYNRKEELTKLLSSLKAQTLPQRKCEIIVIDDGSSDSTVEFLQREQAAGTLTFSVQDHRGPGAARNMGMKLAQGKILVFTDTDCIPHPHWLENLIHPFADETVGAAGGPEVPDPVEPILSRCFQFVMTSPLTTGGLRGAKKQLARYYPRTFNMAISRKAYEKVGGFKEWYHGEDVEMSFRIKEAGFKLIYCDDAKVYHHRPATFSSFFLQLLKMGEARWLLFRTHRELIEPLFLLPPSAIVLLTVLLVLSPFSPAILSLLQALLTLGIIYLAMVGLSAWSAFKSVRAFFLAPLAFICQQVGYGAGFLYGLTRFTISERA
jgi:cellulose synthase/poly-beta-1,6-N-acetylglucosamine synthase-like glycosyltransferase